MRSIPLLISTLAVVMTLAACGVDGEPEPPTAAPVGPQVSGTVSVGIAGGS